MPATATDVNTVSDRLGHATAGFTLSTYGHSLPGRQAEAGRGYNASVSRLDRDLGRAAPVPTGEPEPKVEGSRVE